MFVKNVLNLFAIYLLSVIKVAGVDILCLF